MIGPASLFHSWHWVLFNLIHQVERRYTRMAGTVHAEAHDILAEIEDILVRNVWEISTKSIDFSSLWFQKDEDFTFAVPGQPTWKREEFKVNYPPFRRLVGDFFLCIFCEENNSRAFFFDKTFCAAGWKWRPSSKRLCSNDHGCSCHVVPGG